MIALLAALAVGLLIALQPWAATSVAPQLGLAPGLGVGLADSVPAAPARPPAVAAARPAVGGGARLVADEGAATEGDSRLEVGLASARAVAHGDGALTTESPPEAPAPGPSPNAVPEQAPASSPEPVAAPAPQPVAAVPVRVPYAPGAFPSGPTTAGPGAPLGGFEEPLEIGEGDEYSFSFSFYAEQTAYRAPGEDNSILRFASDPGEAPTFALQLWDDGTDGRGLWSSGAAMEGERFLAPLVEGVWHRVAVYFVASSEEDGLYVLILDGQPIETRAWVSLLPASGSARLEAGLFRAGEPVLGASDVLFGPSEVSEDPESVLP